MEKAVRHRPSRDVGGRPARSTRPRRHDPERCRQRALPGLCELWRAWRISHLRPAAANQRSASLSRGGRSDSCQCPRFRARCDPRQQGAPCRPTSTSTDPHPLNFIPGKSGLANMRCKSCRSKQRMDQGSYGVHAAAVFWDRVGRLPEAAASAGDFAWSRQHDEVVLTRRTQRLCILAKERHGPRRKKHQRGATPLDQGLLRTGYGAPQARSRPASPRMARFAGGARHRRQKSRFRRSPMPAVGRPFARDTGMVVAPQTAPTVDNLFAGIGLARSIKNSGRERE